MSKDSGKAEPSMDDILASIRRIIDEDGSKTRKPAAASGGKSASDILELTEMVNDDGSVTSLEKQSAAATTQPKFVDEDEPPIYAEREERPTAFGAPEPARPTLAGDPRAPNAPQPAVERPPQSPLQQAAPRPPISPPPAPPAAQPMPSQPPRITPSPAMGGPISLTPVATPAATPASAPPSSAGLVSSQAANAATAAFDRLAQAALQQQQPPAPPAASRAPSPTVGGRALEDMVSEMLRPMLQQWLDTNLPAIVERLVQQEIQKMSKR